MPLPGPRLSRLTCIAHRRPLILYKAVEREAVTLPKRVTDNADDDTRRHGHYGPELP